jgi:hypothetical protein
MDRIRNSKSMDIVRMAYNDDFIIATKTTGTTNFYILHIEKTTA